MKTIEQKAKAYDEAIDKLQSLITNANKQGHIIIRIEDLENSFPELKESEDEKSKKWILEYLHDGLQKSDEQFKEYFKAAIACLEKHGTSYTNRDDEKIRKDIIRVLKGEISFTSEKENEKYIAWLEKQGEKKSKKVSLWKHWKDGIAGNAEGKQIYLTKIGNTYNLSSYLSFECDYIELSDLDNLMSKGQCEPNPYSGVSFEYNGHAWGMCARDGGVEIGMDGDLKAFISSDKSFIFSQPTLTPKSTLEAVMEEKVDNQNCANPTNNPEPNFYEEDWITIDNDNPCQIINIDNRGNYIVQYCNDEETHVLSKKFCESHYHLWTIQDAKEGDVLIGNIDGDEYILIFKEIKDGWIETYGHYYGCVDRFCVQSQLFCRDYKGTFYPANKELRDFLISKINESEYEWDDDKKELKKIEHNTVEFDDTNAKRMFIKALERVEEQNNKGYKLTDCDKNSWWEDFKAYISYTDEQNPTNNPEQKFHEGDWVVNDKGVTRQIAIANPGYYILNNGMEFSKSYVEKYWHLWTIQDANDGDVLVASDGSIFLFAGVDVYACKYYGVLTAYNEVKINKEVYGSDYWETSCAVHPATKEQRDLLFSKMKEVGYEWDADKKELKKIDDEEINGENYGIDGFWHAKRILEKTLGSVSGYQTDDGILDHKAAITAVKKLYEQKPTWTEEDEKRLNSCLIILQPKTLVGNTETMNTKWLKSLKERIGG